eukprot:15383908-Alexandrium_andersonii.AAC.1
MCIRDSTNTSPKPLIPRQYLARTSPKATSISPVPHQYRASTAPIPRQHLASTSPAPRQHLA